MLRLMPTLAYCKLLIISLYGKLWSISFVMSTIALKWILGPTNMFVGVEVLKPKLWIIFFMYNTMQKRGVLQLALQLNFWVVEDTCNSHYLYVISANGHVAWIA